MIKIVTDSSCDLPEDIIREYGITVVPMNVEIDGQHFMEDVDISPEEFWKKMDNSSKLPKTAQPSPGKFAEVFKKIQNEGDEPLCITISSKLSGTYQSALIGGGLSGDKATVFDSLAGSLSHGIQVLKAARLAKEGKNIKDILEILKKHRAGVEIIIPLDTLENIVKGGRLSKFQGSLAKILNIKVILKGINGEVKLFMKVRGSKKFKQSILEIIKTAGNSTRDLIFGITHVDNLKDANFFKEEIIKLFGSVEVIINSMGPTMATYAGKGGMIITF